jgi:hypothetical protein
LKEDEQRVPEPDRMMCALELLGTGQLEVEAPRWSGSGVRKAM